MNYGIFQKQWIAEYGAINLDEWRFEVVPLPRAMWKKKSYEGDVKNELEGLGNSIINGDLSVEDIRANQPKLYRLYKRTLERIEAIVIRKNTVAEFCYVGDWQPNPSDEYKSYQIRHENLQNDVYHYWPRRPQQPTAGTEGTSNRSL